uniref:Zgc:158689 n=1 Tax=Oncorhynchus mykiss TaxID=8022 RepID=A0A8L0DRH4_ONCMY
MSRSDEVNKMTENVYKGILDQFNPSLKNFVTMGKHYEKALTGVTVAAKGYFDGLVKLGELASDSQGSKELGDTLFQMAEVHRQIQVQLEDVLKLFHSELLSQLEQKLELDIKYLTPLSLQCIIKVTYLLLLCLCSNQIYLYSPSYIS